MKIGLIGLGRMGSGHCAAPHASRAATIVAWDHAEKATEAAAKRGVPIAADPKAVAAAAEIVISIITEDNGVRKVFTGPDGLLAGRRERQAVHRDEHAAADDRRASWPRSSKPRARG